MKNESLRRTTGTGMFRIEILSTGEEILTGSIADTNAAFLSDQLGARGFRVVRHTSVGDDIDQIAKALKEIAERADAAIVTGGLGPTTDDLTAEAAAAAASTGMTLHLKSMERLEAFFRSRGYVMPEANRKQAMVPETAAVLPNEHGTAPGFIMRIDGCRFFFLPGVPFEMKRMFEAQVLPAIRAMADADPPDWRIKTFSVFGIPESKVNERLRDFPKKYSALRLGFRAKFPEIQIKLYASGDEMEKAASAREEIRKIFGTYLFSEDGMPMEAQVGQLLRRKNGTLAVAESCTGGLVSHMLTDTPGSSDYFVFSAVTYANEAKIKILGVSPATLRDAGAVSLQTAEEMAEGVRRMAGSTYGLATSGIAGPGGGSLEKPVGTVCIGIAGPEGSQSVCVHYPFPERSRNKQVFAMKALDLLRRHLLDHEAT